MVTIAACNLKMICFYKIKLAVHHFAVPFIRTELFIRISCAVYTPPFVYDEDLMWSIQCYYFCLLANQLKVAAVAFRV